MVARLYALVVLLAVAWAGYTAVAYLFRSVFRPVQVPAWVCNWARPLDPDELRTAAVPGVSAPTVRAPLDHYHGVERWFEPDPHNGCTASGCHEMLPHTKSKPLRAFANLHSTFMVCEMCHTATDVTPLPAVWVNTATGEAQGVPAILQLISLFERQGQPGGVDDTAGRLLLELLPEVVRASGSDPLLSYMAVELQTTEPGSPVWHRTLEQLTAELPNHAHGEYGAKLCPTTAPASQPLRRDYTALIREYQAAPADSDDREEINKRIHAEVMPEPAGCAPCHRQEQPRLDFRAVGYSPQQVVAMTGEPVAQMMQTIWKGGTFSLPRISENPDDRQ